MKDIESMSFDEVLLELAENPEIYNLIKNYIGLNEKHQEYVLKFCRNLRRIENERGKESDR